MRTTGSRLLLVALVVVAVGLPLLLLLRPGGERPDAAESTGRAAAAPGPAQAPDLDQPPAPELGGVAEPVPGPVSAREELPVSAETEVGPPATQLLHGRVRWPEGTPSDERAVVLATSEERRLPDLYGGRSALAERARTTGDLESEPRLLGVAATDEQGRFELALASGTAEAHLAVAGRYVFSRATTRVTVGRKDDVLLAPELGGWIVGRVEGPEESVVADLPVELGPDLSGGFRPMEMAGSVSSRRARTDSQGRFEFGGVPAALSQILSVRHPNLATKFEGGIALAPGERRVVLTECTAGAILRGRVLDERGEPVEDADVGAHLRGLLGEAGDALREAETNGDGDFLLLGVAPGALTVKASKRGYLDAVLRLDQPVGEGKALAGLELVLSSGESIAGTVLLPGGGPAAGATVRARPDPLRPRGPGLMPTIGAHGGRAETDEAGHFEIGGLSDVPYVVTARLDPEPTLVSGPTPLPEPGPAEQGTSASAQATDVIPGEGEVLLQLEFLALVAGRVTDLEGAPVTEFAVTATRIGSGVMFNLGAERITHGVENEEGMFQLAGLRPAAYDLTVSAPGFGPSEPLEVAVPREDGAEPIEITLAPSAAVAGVVVDTEGVSVSGAKVTVQLDLAALISSMEDNGPASVYTDAEGRFALEDVGPGSVSFAAELEGFAPSEAATVELASGERVEDVVLRLRVGGVVAGEVLDDEGEPDPSRMVIVQSMPGFTRQHFSHTDADGRFRVEHVAPGSYQIVATGDIFGGDDVIGEGEQALEGFLNKMDIEFVEVVDGEETWVTLGAPPADPVHVSVVVTHDGQPVEGVMVVTVPGEREGGLDSFGMKFTDEQGGLELDLDGPGDWLFTVQGQVGMGQQNAVEFLEHVAASAEGQKIELALPTGRISGTVFGPDGAPISGARITLNIEGGNTFGSFLGGQYAEVVTEKDGTYDLPWLRAGTYTVSAGGALLGGMLGSQATHGRVLQSGIAVSAGSWVAGVDFRLEEPGRIEGVVRDAGGAPLEGATIFVRDEQGALMDRFSLFTSDAAGRFEYEGVAPGRYTVEARAKGLAGESPTVQVSAGGSAHAEVSLAAGTVLVVSVVDQADSDVRSQVSVTDEDGREHNGLMSMDAILSAFGEGYTSTEQRIGPLAPGRYLVRAVAADGRESVKPVFVDGQQERKVKLRLK
jgi:protocatechuate 3,4-dioxygenase beta subunit